MHGEYAYLDEGIAVEGTTIGSLRKKRGFYQSYTPEDKARIARFAIEHGIAKAVRHFSQELNKKLRESTVREFKKRYLSQTQGKNVEFITEIESKPRGRPKVPLPPKPETPPLPPGQRRKRGEYQKYTPEIKATLAKYAIDLGCAKAAKYFSKLMNRNINESTIRSFRKSYLMQANGGDLDELKRMETKRNKSTITKPQSTQIIDHLIEFGSFPSQYSNCENVEVFIPMEGVENLNDGQEGASGSGEEDIVIEKGNRSGCMEERDSSYPVIITPEKMKEQEHQNHVLDSGHSNNSENIESVKHRNDSDISDSDSKNVDLDEQSGNCESESL